MHLLVATLAMISEKRNLQETREMREVPGLGLISADDPGIANVTREEKLPKLRRLLHAGPEAV